MTSNNQLYKNHSFEHNLRLFKPNACLTTLLSFPANNQFPLSFLNNDWGHQFVNARYNDSFNLHSAKQDIRHLQEKHMFIEHKSADDEFAQSPLDCISDVPEVFLRKDFDLKLETTFNEIFPANLFTIRDCSAAEFHELHDKMTFYVDIIEQHISSSVGKCSSKFFNAVLAHEEMQDSILHIQSFISKIRHELRLLEQTIDAELPPVLSRLCHAKNNSKTLLKILKKIARVQSTHPTIESLLTKSDFLGVFVQIDSIKELFTNDLTGIRALGNVSQQIASLSWNVESLLADNFADICSAYFRGSYSINDYREKLANYVQAHLYKRRLGFLRVILDEAVGAVEFYTQENGTDDGNTFSENTISLWISCLERLLVTVVSVSDKFKALSDFVVSITTPESGRINRQSRESGSLSNGVRDKVVDDLMVIYHEYCNHIFKMVGDFVNAATQYPHLGTVNIIDIATIYTVLTNSVSDLDRSFMKISSCLRFKISDFIAKYANLVHDQVLSNMRVAVSGEKWRLVDCPQLLQQLLAVLEDFNDSGSFDIPTLTLLLDSDNLAFANPGRTTNCKNITFYGKSYILVGSSLFLLRNTLIYVNLVRLLPCLGTIAAMNCADFIGKFNLLCYHNISQNSTGKTHSFNYMRGSFNNVQIVGICYCTIELIGMAITPIQRLFVHLSSDNYAGQQIIPLFDKIKQDITKHHNELDKRIYNMICTPVINEIKKWDKREGHTMNSLMRSISQHLKKCHSLLSGFVTNSELSDHLIRLFESVNTEIRDKTQVVGSDEDVSVAFIQLVF